MSTDGNGDSIERNVSSEIVGEEQQQSDRRTIASNSMHKLPVFWSAMPEVWFIQVEQIFCLNRITSDISKYRHVVAVLPQEAMSNVIDLLRNPPDNEKYEKLKDALISRHSKSETKKLEELLKSSEMGDRSPSTFYREMENILGNSSLINPGLLKQLWIRKLPEAVKIFVTSSNIEDITELLVMADKVWDATQTYSLSAIASKPSKPSVNENQLIEAIRSLSLEVASLKENFSRHRRNERFSQSGRRRSTSRSRTRENKGYCWYHTNFGDRADKCISPCQYTADTKNKENLKD